AGDPPRPHRRRVQRCRRSRRDGAHPRPSPGGHDLRRAGAGPLSLAQPGRGGPLRGARRARRGGRGRRGPRRADVRRRGRRSGRRRGRVRARPARAAQRRRRGHARPAARPLRDRGDRRGRGRGV
ncbi:MAG: hypothetical protein AVDCRST_MAG85-3650, partial [uncultured Solirubrobacteraceae bacterium]